VSPRPASLDIFDIDNEVVPFCNCTMACRVVIIKHRFWHNRLPSSRSGCGRLSGIHFDIEVLHTVFKGGEPCSILCNKPLIRLESMLSNFQMIFTKGVPQYLAGKGALGANYAA